MSHNNIAYNLQPGQSVMADEHGRPNCYCDEAAIQQDEACVCPSEANYQMEMEENAILMAPLWQETGMKDIAVHGCYMEYGVKSGAIGGSFRRWCPDGQKLDSAGKCRKTRSYSRKPTGRHTNVSFKMGFKHC